MQLSTISSRKLLYGMTFVYLFFSVFEFFINATIGNISRYVMLFYVCCMILSSIKRGTLEQVTGVQISVGILVVHNIVIRLKTNHIPTLI